MNDTFWTGAASGAPVFLCVGGEGPPLTGASVVNSVHCSNAAEWLPETGALMLALQHRYYGCFNASACPVPDVSAPGALKFLSSRQAVGDVARFLEVVAQQYSLTSANKIVSWGGSYPGMLASFVRLKLPHLVHAAVSSSAPVQAQLDMRGYFDVVAAACVPAGRHPRAALRPVPHTLSVTLLAGTRCPTTTWAARPRASPISARATPPSRACSQRTLAASG